MADPNLDEGDWRSLPEDQLEILLFKKVEFLFSDVWSRLSLIYSEEVAQNVLLTAGHSFGKLDLLSNILHNSIGYLSSRSESLEKSELLFENLSELVERTFVDLISSFQKVRPGLSKVGVMYFLLMSGLHVEGAKIMSLEAVNVLGDAPTFQGWVSGEIYDSSVNGPFSFGDTTLTRVIEFLLRPNTSPSMKSLKKNLADTTLSRDVEFLVRSNSSPSQKSLREVLALSAWENINYSEYKKSSESLYWDMVGYMLSWLDDLSIDEKLNGWIICRKNQIRKNLQCKITTLEQRVKEEKEWAREKSEQIDKQHNDKVIELEMLRMGRKETQPLEENDPRMTTSQVDHENDAVRRLEIENAVIRADVESSKLSASELVRTRMVAEKSEKKYLKRISEWDKHNIQLREVKQKILQLPEQLLLVKESQREAEVKCKLELKAKEMIMTELQEEQGSNEAYEIKVKKLEDLRQEKKIVSQSCGDDLQRLEKELSELKVFAETVGRMFHELNKVQESSEKEANCNMKCIFCIDKEASVVYLPCAHQVLCASCDNYYALLRNTTCPHCFVQIKEKINL